MSVAPAALKKNSQLGLDISASLILVNNDFVV